MSLLFQEWDEEEEDTVSNEVPMYRMEVPWVQSLAEREQADDAKLEVLLEHFHADRVPISSNARPRLATWRYPPSLLSTRLAIFGSLIPRMRTSLRHLRRGRVSVGDKPRSVDNTLHRARGDAGAYDLDA
jgi:hypothetical protein